VWPDQVATGLVHHSKITNLVYEYGDEVLCGAKYDLVEDADINSEKGEIMFFITREDLTEDVIFVMIGDIMDWYLTTRWDVEKQRLRNAKAAV